MWMDILPDGDSTVTLILTSLLSLPLLASAMARSPRDQRRIILKRLSDESEPVITEEEYKLAKSERDFLQRSVPGYPHHIGRAIVLAQNELATRKDYLSRNGGIVDDDPVCQGIRAEIACLRRQNSTGPSG